MSVESSTPINREQEFKAQSPSRVQGSSANEYKNSIKVTIKVTIKVHGQLHEFLDGRGRPMVV